jgi:hypothetical protein
MTCFGRNYQPLPLDDSPEGFWEYFHPEKLGIVTPALRAAQHLPRKRRGAGVSLASVGLVVTRFDDMWDLSVSVTYSQGHLV